MVGFCDRSDKLAAYVDEKEMSTCSDLFCVINFVKWFLRRLAKSDTKVCYL